MLARTAFGAMGIDAKSFLKVPDSVARIRRLALTIGFVLIATLIQPPYALSLDPERTATVNSGERVRIWFGANYGRPCRTAGPVGVT